MTIAVRPRQDVEPGPFRDRTARVFHAAEAVCRALTAPAWDEWQDASAARFVVDERLTLPPDTRRLYRATPETHAR